MLVSDTMTRDLVTAPPTLTVADGLARALERDVHHLLVADQDRLLGVLCVCELRNCSPTDPLSKVARVPVVISPASTLKEAANCLIDRQLSCLPVCDGPRLVGVITRADLRGSLDPEVHLPNTFFCRFCGSTRHVRPLRGDGLPACLECSDRIAPARTRQADARAER